MICHAVHLNYILQHTERWYYLPVKMLDHTLSLRYNKKPSRR